MDVVIQERDAQTEARVNSRMRVLEDLPSDITEEEKLRAAAELKALKLISFQQTVCSFAHITPTHALCCWLDH